MYSNRKYRYINEEILKNIRAGNLGGFYCDVFVMTLFVLILSSMDSADAFALLQKLQQALDSKIKAAKNQPASIPKQGK
jgi:hypothetical protein